MEKTVNQIVTILGGSVILVIALFYWYGGVQYVQALFGGSAGLVNSYGALLKQSYPTNTGP